MKVGCMCLHPPFDDDCWKKEEKRETKKEATVDSRNEKETIQLGKKKTKTGLKTIEAVSSFFRQKSLFCSLIQSKIRSLFTQREAA